MEKGGPSEYRGAQDGAQEGEHDGAHGAQEGAHGRGGRGRGGRGVMTAFPSAMERSIRGTGMT